jgi:RNA polymerase sigma-70 factor, ECF subfamily
MEQAGGQLDRELADLLPQLRRFARALTRHAQDADDLVQSALERALRNADQWQRDRSLRNWMLGIIKNAWIDEVRARGRRHLVSLDETVELPDPMAAVKIDLLAVQQCLERLPDDQRVAIALVLVEGLSYKEAAAVLEIPIGTLTSRLARGRAVLVSMLEPTFGTKEGRGNEISR